MDDVFSHTLGNPYLNILVAEGLEPTARRLPKDLPADLRVAVRRTWHSLSPLAREITSPVAVGGGPVRPELLQDIASDLGLDEVGAALQEAEESRLLTLVDGERLLVPASLASPGPRAVFDLQSSPSLARGVRAMWRGFAGFGVAFDL